jgi:hypothetical protein
VGTFPVPTLIEGGPASSDLGVQGSASSDLGVQGSEVYSITFNDNNPKFFNDSYHYEVNSTDIIAPTLDLSITLPADNDELYNDTSMFEMYSNIRLLYGCGLDTESGVYRGFNYINSDGIYQSQFTYTPGQVLRYLITARDQTVYLDNQILSYRNGTEFNSPAWKLQFVNYGANNTSSSNPYLYNQTTWKIKVAIPPLITPIIYPPKVVGLIGNCYVRRPDRNNVSESQRMLREQCTTVIINKESKTVVAAQPLDVSAVPASGAASASVSTSQTKDAVLLAFENNPAMRFNEFLGPLPPANPCPTPPVNAGVPKPSVIGCGPGTIKPFNP